MTDITEKLDDRLKRQDEAVHGYGSPRILSKSDIKWAQQRIKQLDMYVADLKKGISSGDRNEIYVPLGGIEGTLDMLKKNLKLNLYKGK